MAFDTHSIAKVVNEHQVIAPMGAIYDAQGKLVKRLSDGVPAKISFTMPKESEFFDLIVGEHRVRQRVRE